MRNFAGYKAAVAASVLVLGVLISRPNDTVADPDTPFNIDGIGGVDFCDYSLFATDWGGNNPRSDFNGDGQVNLALM